MNEQEIKDLIAKLEDTDAAIQLIAMDKHKAVETVITPEIEAKIAEIDAEFDGKAKAAQEAYALLKQQVADAVAKHGASVSGARFQAQFVRGRVSWDTKRLDVMADTIPDLLKARSEGEPTVRLVPIKAK
jgi:phage host-nuclease inhibitor protein Gam